MCSIRSLRGKSLVKETVPDDALGPGEVGCMIGRPLLERRSGWNDLEAQAQAARCAKHARGEHHIGREKEDRHQKELQAILAELGSALNVVLGIELLELFKPQPYLVAVLA